MPEAHPDIHEERVAYALTLNGVPNCEEFRRMVSGCLYDESVDVLRKKRMEALRLVHQYCNLIPTEDMPPSTYYELRIELLKKIVGFCGKDVVIEPSVFFTYGCNTSLGDAVYCNSGVKFIDVATIKVGARTLIGPSVNVITASHPLNYKQRAEALEYGLPVEIGEDCWIGANVQILPGVKVGRGCVIGAGSVVNKDIPNFSLVVGVPARVIRHLHPDDHKKHSQN